MGETNLLLLFSRTGFSAAGMQIDFLQSTHCGACRSGHIPLETCFEGVTRVFSPSQLRLENCGLYFTRT